MATGTPNINAAVSGIVGVTPAATAGGTVPVSIEISPPAPSVPVAFAQPLQATAVFSDGTVLDVTRHCSWTTSDSLIATVSNAGALKGLASPAAAGTTQVTVRRGSVTASDFLTVTGSTVTSIEVSGASSTVPVGLSLPLQRHGHAVGWVHARCHGFRDLGVG